MPFPVKNRRILARSIAAILLFVIATGATRAADVLQNVPNDALGFLVINNMSASDAKIAKLLASLKVKFPPPLAFVVSNTGLGEGLDAGGNLLFAVIPGGEEPQFCVWLPVRDYDRFLTSVEARQRDGIVPVVVAGEDILVARHGDFVLIMDPDQRERMAKLLAEKPKPPEVVDQWQDWIGTHDAAVVILPSGVRAVLAWADASYAAPDAEGEENHDDIFGQAAEDPNPFVAAQHESDSDPGPFRIVRRPLRSWISRSPKLARLMPDAQAIACAVRLDDQGNALAGARVVCSTNPRSALGGNETDGFPPALYQGGSFVFYGAGSVPPALLDIAAEMFVRDAVNDLKGEQRLVLDERAIARFQQSVQNAAQNVRSVAVLTQPGEKSAGVYTNDFLVVRTDSADAFVERAADVLRLWNTLNREAEGESPLIFDIEEIEVGKRTATCYTLNVAGEEALAIPEVRQAMEKFFGPGGKMQLWMTRVDDRNVLFAAATQDEVAAALELLDRKQPLRWDQVELAGANVLLPDKADWRLFLSPHAYAAWQQRLSSAMTGPVFGARPRKEFRMSPPIGLAGGLRNEEFWIDAAVPAETIRNAGEYFK
jgi:hypothetical protein